MDGEIVTIEVPQGNAPERIDRFLKGQYPDYSRNYFQNLLEKGAIRVNGAPVKKRNLIAPQDSVEIAFIEHEEIPLVPQDIPLDTLYEDEHILCVNKPAGLVVHPGAGNKDHTLVNALLFRLGALPENGLRPGIVHRLDKDTSGVIVTAKTTRAHLAMSEIFANRQIKKTYHAIALGNPGTRRLTSPIGRHPIYRQKMCVRDRGGKIAVTDIETLSFKEGISFLKIGLHTGRTHQIRVHLQSINCPLLGDAVYGVQKFGATRPLLHASSLHFIHPFTHEELHIEAPLPADFSPFIS